MVDLAIAHTHFPVPVAPTFNAALRTRYPTYSHAPWVVTLQLNCPIVC